jgi:hypothetical protein
MVIQILMAAIQSALEPDESGNARPRRRTCPALGGAVGAAVYGAVLTGGLRHRLALEVAGDSARGLAPTGIQGHTKPDPYLPGRRTARRRGRRRRLAEPRVPGGRPEGVGWLPDPSPRRASDRSAAEGVPGPTQSAAPHRPLRPRGGSRPRQNEISLDPSRAEQPIASTPWSMSHPRAARCHGDRRVVDENAPRAGSMT